LLGHDFSRTKSDINHARMGDRLLFREIVKESRDFYWGTKILAVGGKRVRGEKEKLRLTLREEFPTTSTGLLQERWKRESHRQTKEKRDVVVNSEVGEGKAGTTPKCGVQVARWRQRVRETGTGKGFRAMEANGKSKMGGV